MADSRGHSFQSNGDWNRLHATSFTAYEFQMRSATDRRRQVGRFGMVTYVDAKLCRRAFALTPTQVKRRISKQVEFANASRRGILVVTSRELLSTEDLAARGEEIRNLLPNSPFA